MTAPSGPLGKNGTPDSPEAPEGGGGEISTRRIELVNVALVLAAAALAYFLWTPQVAVGMILGGALSAASFRVIAVVMKAIFAKGSTSFWPVATFWIKYSAMMAAVGALVLIYRVDVIGLLIGLSLLLPAIVVEAVLRMALDPS